MQMQILQMQKMQKLFCINTKNNAKTRENTRTRSRAENGRKSAKKRQKNGKNATTASGANDEQIRINGINARRKLLLYIDLVQVYNLQLQKMQMQILHSFALSYYANADFATRLHYVYVFVYVYVYDLKRVAHKCARGRSRRPVPQQSTARHYRQDFLKHKYFFIFALDNSANCLYI